MAPTREGNKCAMSPATSWETIYFGSSWSPDTLISRLHDGHSSALLSALCANGLRVLPRPGSTNSDSPARTAWMNGIQFFLRDDVPLDHGHTLDADSPWALTSVSQRQFWQHIKLADYGNGQVGGILSADISAGRLPASSTANQPCNVPRRRSRTKPGHR